MAHNALFPKTGWDAGPAERANCTSDSEVFDRALGLTAATPLATGSTTHNRRDHGRTTASYRTAQPSVPPRRCPALADEDTRRQRRDIRNTGMCLRVLLRGPNLARLACRKPAATRTLRAHRGSRAPLPRGTTPQFSRHAHNEHRLGKTSLERHNARTTALPSTDEVPSRCRKPTAHIGYA